RRRDGPGSWTLPLCPPLLRAATLWRVGALRHDREREQQAKSGNRGDATHAFLSISSEAAQVTWRVKRVKERLAPKHESVRAREDANPDLRISPCARPQTNWPLTRSR